MDSTGKKKIAIVTGASGGFGKEFASLLSCFDDIDEVWAVARSTDKLDFVRAQLGEKIRPVALDLSDRRSASVIADMLAEEKPSIGFLVNNAGFAKFCSYADISLEESLNMIDLNVSAVVALTLTCLPYMGEGAHILNIASQASFQPLPYMNLYAATKAFVRSYTRALNVELRSRGITATAVCPGWMDTDLYARGNVGAEKGANRFKAMASPRKVAVKALADARRGKDISVYGARVKFAHLASKIFSERKMMKLWLRQQHIRID